MLGVCNDCSSETITIYNIHLTITKTQSIADILRWVGGGWDAIEKADADGKLFGVHVVKDRWERPVRTLAIVGGL